MPAEQVIYLVDDEPDVLTGLGRLVRSAGYRVTTFQSAQAFLDQVGADDPGCVVLDLSMPQMDGLALQNALAARDVVLPIIFLSGRAEVPRVVQSLKRGALDFLMKPVEREVLLDAICRALEHDHASRRQRAARMNFEALLATLTPREKEVFSHVISGRLNKQIAFDLGTVEKTIKVHRSRVMHKLGVGNLADLARMAEQFGMAPAASGRTEPPRAVEHDAGVPGSDR